jgi:hypothetical protein
MAHADTPFLRQWVAPAFAFADIAAASPLNSQRPSAKQFVSHDGRTRSTPNHDTCVTLPSHDASLLAE